MALIPAKCTQCGANIEVDDTHEAGICKYCGTAFITEKAIHNYNISITNNNNFAGANVSIVAVDIHGLLESAKQELILKNYSNANVYLEEVKKNDANAIKLISNLFYEVKILEQAKKQWEKDANSSETKEVINELITYDSQNIEVWLFMMETSFWPKDTISYGEKVMALAPVDKKDYYAEKVFYMYIEKEFNPQKAVSKECLIDEIPAYAIEKNNILNQLLYNKCKLFIQNNTKAVINAYQEKLNKCYNKLQPNEKNEILKMIGSSKNGCYIATCVYGSYDCPEVWTLRRFRDYTLDTTWGGRLFIKCYYAISPTIVKWFGHTEWFKTFWRIRIDKMVNNLKQRNVDDSPYIDKY